MEGIIDLGLIQYAIDAKISTPTLPLTLYLWHKSTHQDVWIANDNLSPLTAFTSKCILLFIAIKSSHKPCVYSLYMTQL